MASQKNSFASSLPKRGGANTTTSLKVTRVTERRDRRSNENNLHLRLAQNKAAKYNNNSNNNEFECIGDADGPCIRQQDASQFKNQNEEKKKSKSQDDGKEGNELEELTRQIPLQKITRGSKLGNSNIFETYAVIRLILQNVSHEETLELRGLHQRWNYLACQKLLKSSVAHIYSRRRLEMFTELVRRNKKLGLPFPIQDLSIVFTGTFKEFDEIEKLFSMHEEPEQIPQAESELLQRKKSRLYNRPKFAIVALNLTFTTFESNIIVRRSRTRNQNQNQNKNKNPNPNPNQHASKSLSATVATSTISAAAAATNPTKVKTKVKNKNTNSKTKGQDRENLDPETIMSESDKVRKFIWDHSKKLEGCAITLRSGCQFNFRFGFQTNAKACAYKLQSKHDHDSGNKNANSNANANANSESTTTSGNMSRRKSKSNLKLKSKWNPNLNLKNFVRTPFPRLRHICFNDGNEDPKHIMMNCSSFLSLVINCSPALTSLSYACFSHPSIFLALIRDIRPGVLQNLTYLASPLASVNQIEGFTGTCITSTSIDRKFETLPNLKSIRVENIARECSVPYETFDRFINSISGHLEKLVFNCKVVREVVDGDGEEKEIRIQNEMSKLFPYCPKLKCLEVKGWTGSLEAFTTESLPQLRQLSLENFNGFGAVLCLHPGVQDFCLTVTKNIAHIDNQLLFNIVCTRFPNITGLFLMLDEWKSTHLRNLVQFFPKVKRLSLSVSTSSMEFGSGPGPGSDPGIGSTMILSPGNRRDFDQEIFTGIPNIATKSRSIVRKESSKLSMRRTLPCLIDLRHLEALDLSTGPPVSNVIIKRGLALIPNLKRLACNFSTSITPQIIQEYLNHLSLLLITNPRRLFSPAEFRNLLRILKVKVKLGSAIEHGGISVDLLNSNWIFDRPTENIEDSCDDIDFVDNCS